MMKFATVFRWKSLKRLEMAKPEYGIIWRGARATGRPLPCGGGLGRGVAPPLKIGVNPNATTIKNKMPQSRTFILSFTNGR
jgi:hypothetical protein